MKALVVVALLAFARAAGADSEPTFAQDVAAARRARVGCDAAAGGFGQRAHMVERACRAGRFKLEWIVCQVRRDRGCERYLIATQRKQLDKVLTGPIEAEPVESDHVLVDRIAVTKGKLADGGAGFARRVHRTLDGCREVGTIAGGTTQVTVKIGATDADAVLVARNAKLRACLYDRLKMLVWTDPVEHVHVQARAIVRN